ncbi:MAG: DNA-3-methyladenine glycosylase, partial [Calditrichaeota bacterium]
MEFALKKNLVPISRDFFNRPTLKVARELLGMYLVRQIDDTVMVGKIVETEAYIGEDDPACHAARGYTNRTSIMYGPPGYAYIYFIYGMYHCLNVVTEKEGFP